MTRLVVVQPNPQSEVPVGLEQGARYVLIGPDGTRAAINDPADIDFIGWLTAPPSGFDSPDVRESSDLIVEGDGGVHGNFYFGRRPWTLTGMIDTEPRHPGDELVETAALVNRRINRLQRASRALRSDATLTWTPQGGVPVQVRGRRQQPLRVTERFPKQFLLAMVSSEARILGQIIRSESAPNATAITAVNDGNTPTSAVITLRDAWTNPILSNELTGQNIELALTMSGGDTLVIDGDAETITLNGVNRYSALSFLASDWWDQGCAIEPGSNVLTATGGASGASWQVDSRDAWI